MTKKTKVDSKKSAKKPVTKTGLTNFMKRKAEGKTTAKSSKPTIPGAQAVTIRKPAVLSASTED